MPNITRRAVVGGGAGLAAVLAGTTTSVAATPSSLPDLIDSHRGAWVRFEAALDAEDEYLEAKRHEIFVPLSIGGAQSVSAGRHLEDAAMHLRQEIGRLYASETDRANKVLARVSADLAEKATGALRNAQARDLRTMRERFGEERTRREASGYAAAVREYEAAHEAEEAALNAVLSYRCATFAELNMKADYIAKTLEGCVMNEEQIELLLSSMRTGREAA